MARARATPAGPGTVYRVYTLGRFQVCRDDKPLQFAVRAHRKPLELLKVLIAQGGEQVAEDLLCDALWPDTEGDQAHSTLASTLHRLRRLVGPQSLLLRDRRLTLNAECCWVDALAFAGELQQATNAAVTQDDDRVWAHLEQALALYRGPFLEGESEPPEILSARERLHGMFLRHIREWGARFSARGDPERAFVLYQRGLEADALAEELYQALMRLYLEQGQMAEGIAVYRRCRELLQSSAGIAPAAETERLYEACLAGRKAAVEPAASSGPEATASLSPSALPIPPEQPSIAVLAFDNLSGDPEQAALADGISENLITRLAAIPEMLVIARSSTFAYKGKAVDVRQVGSELGVRYVLEGSILQADQHIRVTAQLIDAGSGRHLWAESYDRQVEDFFAVLDEITLKVVTELEFQIKMGDHVRVIARGTDNVSALDYVLRAREQLIRMEPKANARARDLVRVATGLDPRFAWALALEGWSHIIDAMYGWSTDRAASLRQAETLAQRALALNPDTQFAHSLMSRVLALNGRYDEAITAGWRAVEVSPNDPYPISLLSHLLAWAGHAEEALALIKKTLRMQPHLETFQLQNLADVYYVAGQYDEAALWFRKLLNRPQEGPVPRQCWYFLLDCLVALGRSDEARAEATRLLEVHADVTIASALRLIRCLPFKDFSFLERLEASLRKAGLPD
jgi:adenylate cyclase